MIKFKNLRPIDWVIFVGAAVNFVVIVLILAFFVF
jgi:hypothetical protein